VIEYSDFECSYCIQHRQDGVIAELKKKYGSDGDFIFKPVNLAGHQGSDAKGFAALCVAKI
jgi:protein-disulfide isomerase